MSDEFETYFQFPLRYITQQPDDYESMRGKLLGDATNYAAWRWFQQSNGNEIALRAGRYRKNHRIMPNSLHHSHNPWLAAADALHFSWGHSAGEIFNRMTIHANTVFEKDHNEKGRQVRLRRDIFWNIVQHESTWPPMKIRVLCALYAIIGHQQKGYAPITHLLLRAVASGFSGPKEAGDAKLIPESTVRYWLDELHKRALYRVCMHAGRRYYAIGYFETDEQLAQWVQKTEPKKRPKKRVIKTSELQDSPATPQPSQSK